jgi:hypothetical protein
MLTYGLDNILAVLTLILVSGTILTVPTAMLLLSYSGVPCRRE